MKNVILIVLLFAFAKAYSQNTKVIERRQEGNVSKVSVKADSETIKRMKQQIAKSVEEQKQMLGKPLNYFEMVDIDNIPISSKDLKGKITVVNFWYKECKPCIEEMPELNELMTKYDNQNIQFIGFCTTEQSRLGDFFEKHPFNYRQVANSRPYARSNNIFIFPTNIILDTEGNITYIHSGYEEGLAATIESEIKKLLK